MARRRVSPRRSTIWSSNSQVVLLEDRVLLSLTIQLDYTYDNTGYFTSHPAAKTVLEQAAQILGASIHDHLSAIPAIPSGGDSWTAQPFDPRNLASTLSIPNLAVPADTIVVFAGATSLPLTTLGEGGSGGFASSGSAAWNTLIATRNQTGAAATPRRDDGTWGGAVTFNTNTAFTYSDSSTPPGSSGPDFLSTAYHELGHVLGLVPGGTEYGYRDLGTNTFNGPRAVAAYGGPVPLDPGGIHWAEGVISGGKHAVMDPTLPVAGQRATFTALDWAALADAGWEVDSLVIASAPPSNVAVGASFGLSVSAKYPDGSTDTSYNGPISLAIATGPVGGTLNGTTTINAISGVATFSGLSLSALGTGYSIRATTDADTPAIVTSPINVTSLAALATHLIVTTQPASSVAVGSAFSVTISAEDSLGNVDTTYSSPVTLTLVANPGGATLSGVHTVNAMQGVATFSGLTLNQVAHGYVLQATASGLSPANTPTFDALSALSPVTVTANLANPTYGQSFVFTATMSGAATFPTPTGTVQFLLDGTNLGSSVIIVSGLATSPAITGVNAGGHSITAIYSGDGTYATGTSVPLLESVAPAVLTITAIDQSKLFGAALPSFPLAYSGLVNNDTPAQLITQVTVSTPATANSASGVYPITPSGASSTNYVIVYHPGTLTVQSPPPPPLILVQSVQLKTIKIGKKRITVIVVTFSGDLDAGTAQQINNYRLVTPGRDRKYGTKDDRTILLKSAVYSTASHSVTLTPRTALSFAPSLQLRLSGTGIQDNLGRAIDGNHDGIAGGDALAILSKNGVQLAALDYVLAEGLLAPKRR